MRTRAERRHLDFTKALRKKKIVEDFYGWEEGYYNNLHQYSKNKIHCSCPLCNFNKKVGSHSDWVRIEALESQMKEE